MSSFVGKKVVYNGGTDSYYGCDEPNELVVGEQYMVVGEDVRSFQTNLTLKGVRGNFNSVWFNEQPEVKKKVWIAKATLYSRPYTFVGKRMSLERLHEDKDCLEQVTTSEVKNVKALYENVYLIETDNSVYITKVKIRTGN